MPYIFKDQIKFDKKVDPRKLRFGSKIDNSNYENEKYHKVKEILSPDLLILDSGLKIRLIGVKPKPEKNDEANQFLKETLKGQKVFLKFDNEKYDEKTICFATFICGTKPL